MEQVKIGKSNVFVYPVGIGANYVGGKNLYGKVDEETGKNIIRTALKLGENIIDTAYFYGLGRSEELIGEVLKEFRRENVVLCTKRHAVTLGIKLF